MFRENFSACVHSLVCQFIWSFFFGESRSTYTLQNSSFASPPDRPPMAIPGVSRATISSQHCFRNSRSRPPWMIQKRFCRSGYLCSSMHRSSHRTDRSIASLMRAWSGEVVAITSSNCIIISDPIEFWREMECSGVSNLIEVSISDAQLQGLLGSHLHWGAIVRAKESDSFLCDRRQLKKRDHLETKWQKCPVSNILSMCDRRIVYLTPHYRSRDSDPSLVTYAHRRLHLVPPDQASDPSDMYYSSTACIPSLAADRMLNPWEMPVSRRAWRSAEARSHGAGGGYSHGP